MTAHAPRVTATTLRTPPPGSNPTLAEVAAHAAAEHGPATAGPGAGSTPDAHTAWQSLSWVMAHGMPHSLRRARVASAAIRSAAR